MPYPLFYALFIERCGGRWRIAQSWTNSSPHVWNKTHGDGLGDQDDCLMRPRLLFAAAALTGRDQPYYLVGADAANRARGVHRSQDHATTPQQEFRRLDEATVALPPGADQCGLLPG